MQAAEMAKRLFQAHVEHITLAAMLEFQRKLKLKSWADAVLDN
jgi:hypothetical protein